MSVESSVPPDGVTRMMVAAQARGLAVELRARPPAGSLDEAARLLGLEPADIAKTIVARPGPGAYVFVVVPGDRQIAWAKVRARLGVNKIKFPDAAEALTATGYARGTITPVGSEPGWPVLVDRALVGRRVALGAGGQGFAAFVEVDDLVRAYGADVADLVE